MSRFKDRASAARELLLKLSRFRNDINAVVFGLPRGGIVTASEIARGLKLPLGFLIVKKIGAPMDSELAIGAVTDNGGFYVDEELKKELHVTDELLEKEIERKREEAKTRYDIYRAHFVNPLISGKTIILVDDGIATGATIIAAARSLQRHGARKIVVTVPAGPCENFDKIRAEVDEIVCLGEDLNFSAVGEYYEEFPEVTDEEVIEILENAKNLNSK